MDGDISSWTILLVGMTHISWFGPLSFTVLFDHLVAGPTLYKYVNDTTLYESSSSTS